MTEDTRTINVERTTSTAHRLLHYDGACGNVHGHNFDWDVDVTVEMDEAGDDNMPLDMKDVSECIDAIDHMTLINKEDDLSTALDKYYTFDGDPTCEVVSQWMAKRIYHLDDAVKHVDLTVAETDKYSVSAHYGRYDMMEDAVDD